MTFTRQPLRLEKEEGRRTRDTTEKENRSILLYLHCKKEGNYRGIDFKGKYFKGLFYGIYSLPEMGPLKKHCLSGSLFEMNEKGAQTSI